jgi:cytochrome c556
MRFFFFVLTAASLLVTACSSAPPAESAPAPAAQPFVFVSDPAMKELMAKKVEIFTGTLWNASLEENAPKKNSDWKKLADAATGLVGAGQSMLAAPLARDQGKWKEETEKFIGLSEAALKAVIEKDLTALTDTANRMTEETCTSCHKLYYTGPGQ